MKHTIFPFPQRYIKGGRESSKLLMPKRMALSQFRRHLSPAGSFENSGNATKPASIHIYHGTRLSQILQLHPNQPQLVSDRGRKLLMKHLRLHIFLLFSLLTSAFSAFPAQRELRGVWIATVSNIDWPYYRKDAAAQQNR